MSTGTVNFFCIPMPTHIQIRVTQEQYDAISTMVGGGKRGLQEGVLRILMDEAVRRKSAENSNTNSPTLIPEKAPLTQDENDVKTCATPQEVELRRILSAIFASGNETVIASAANALAASEEILQLLEVARGRADAEPTPSERGVTGDHQLPEKRGGNVQDIGGGFKKLRGRQG